MKRLILSMLIVTTVQAQVIVKPLQSDIDAAIAKVKADPRIAGFWWNYILERDDHTPIVLSDLKYVKVYYWGVNGSTAVKLIPQPLPNIFITVPCVQGDYKLTVLDQQLRESKFSTQYYANTISNCH